MSPLELLGGLSSLLGKVGMKAFKRIVGASDDAAVGFTPPPSAFVGRSGSELKPPGLANTQPGGDYGGADIRGHALDRMQNRGVVPSVVEDSIRNGKSFSAGNPARRQQYSPSNNITTIAEKDDVVTTRFGKPKIPK